MIDLDRGTLARIDRRLLARLDQDETFRMVRFRDWAQWSTWKRYCGVTGISMGRAIVALIERELVSALGESNGEGVVLMADQAGQQLASRERQVAAREHNVGAAEVRLQGWTVRFRHQEAELQIREQRIEMASKPMARPRQTPPRSVGMSDVRADRASSTTLPRPGRPLAPIAGYGRGATRDSCVASACYACLQT